MRERKVITLLISKTVPNFSERKVVTFKLNFARLWQKIFSRKGAKPQRKAFSLRAFASLRETFLVSACPG
jgi:hypothetical protein